MWRLACISALMFLTAACAIGPSVVARREIHVRHLPPSEADLLEALFRSEAVPLSVHPLCLEVAGTPQDETIGRYVAGLLATHRAGAVNWIEVYTQDAVEEGYWSATFLSVSGTESEPYHWGLEFLIRKSDGLVPPESFRCTVPWG